MPTAESPTWQGWQRHDGRKGIRNVILVIYTVECAKFVAHAVAHGEEDVHVIGFSGCYDNAYAIRLMLALVRHPNIGAVLTVGLGCEYTARGKFFDSRNRRHDPEYREGEKPRAKTAEQISEVPRVSMGLADLTVACECGGSDGTSGLAGNPVVGRLFDLVVDAGGSAIFEEIVEQIGLKEILLQRAAKAEVRDQLDQTYDKAEAYCKSVRQWSASPGNFAGGLTTIEEKSLGAFAKSGSRPIQGVLRVSEMPPHPALWLMDSVPDEHYTQFSYTNPNGSEGIMDIISGGSQIVLFVTGRGSVIGSPVALLIKITGNARTYERIAVPGYRPADTLGNWSGEYSFTLTRGMVVLR